MKNSKVIDLELSEDGEYVESGRDKKEKTRSIAKLKQSQKIKPRRDNSDTFFGGLDLGLDLIEKTVPRIERFLKLRG